MMSEGVGTTSMFELGIVTSEIQPASGPKPGVGEVEIYRLGDDGKGVATGEKVPAYTMFRKPVPVGSHVVLAAMNGHWFTFSHEAPGNA